MPFDPDAYLASKSPTASTGDFDPDAYLANKSPAPEPDKPKPPERGAFRSYLDTLKAPFDLAAGAASSMVAAPIANVAGLAATGYEAAAHGGKGEGDMPGKFRDAVQNRLTYHPDNPTLDRAMEVPRVVGKAVGDVGSAVKDAAKGGAADDSARGMAVNAGAEAAKQALGFAGVKGAPLVPRIGETLRGVPAVAARDAAMNASRDALHGAEAAHGRTQAAKLTEAQTYEDTATRTQRELDAARQRTGVPTQDVLGEQVRTSYGKLMDDAKAARAEAVDPLYAKAQHAAAEREASGARVNVQPAVKDIDEMLKLSENLPDLQAKLQRLRQSAVGVPAKPPVAAPVGAGKVSSTLKRPPVAATPSPGLTYQELDMASRYIKDIAFSGEAEGYGALIRNTAKKLSLALDKQISEFVPEHAAATAKYREMSQPMETLATRIGEALHDTEGGLKGDAYAKVPAQDLPGRIFGKKDRIEQLVDAMAGGKGARAEARAAAQAKVDTWVENWILDKSRGKTPGIAAPGERAALNAAPGARERLASTTASEGAQEARVPELRTGAAAAREEARIAATAKVKVRAAIEQAEVDLRHGATKDAYKGYVAALRQNMTAADPAKYRAAIALIDRAATLEEKTARARKLALGLAGLAGVAGAAKIGMQLPGVL